MSERRVPPAVTPTAGTRRSGAPRLRAGAWRAPQRILNAGWAVIGWYAGIVAWAIVGVVARDARLSPVDFLHAVLLPGPLGDPSTPLWVVAVFAVAMLAVLSGAVWASIASSRERATHVRRPRVIGLPWLAPFATGIVITVGALVLTSGRGLAGIPGDLSAVPIAVIETVLVLVLALMVALCVWVVRGMRRRHREPVSLMQALTALALKEHAEAEAREGEREQDEPRQDDRRLLPTFSEDDEVVEDELRGYLATAAYTDALKRLRSQIEHARNQILYPEQATLFAPTSSPASNSAQSPPNALASCYNTPDITDGWYTLLGDTMVVVAALAAAFDSVGTESAGVAGQLNIDETRHLLASEFVRALRMLLLVRIYALRADINKASYDPKTQKLTFQWPSDVVAAITARRRAYDRLAGLRVLRDALRIPGWKEGDDATEYSAWSRPFGTAREGEVGWSPFARTVGYELRYQQRKVELRQRWYEIRAAAPSLLNPLRVLRATALWLFKVTAGFGFKPRRLAATALGVLAFFSLSYYADEVSSGCTGGARSFADFPREIFYAVNNLTNLGAAEPCGPTRGVLTSIESLIGIFMLSVLAAMLFAWLIDR